MLSDADLYCRGTDTLLAAWEAYARAARGAALHRLPGVAVAVFPHGAERDVYNNAVLERDLAASARAQAISAMETAYTAGGVTRFAAWVHESDRLMEADLQQRGYTLNEVTRAMGVALDDITEARPELDASPAGWSEHLRVAGLPPDLLRGFDDPAFHILVVRHDSSDITTGIAFDHHADCGIYNVGTVESARRRGLGTALTAIQLHDALMRGCQTASLQATSMAERVYAAVGFRDLGQIREYVPPRTETGCNARHPE